jgi:hypothetical protein
MGMSCIKILKKDNNSLRSYVKHAFHAPHSTKLELTWQPTIKNSYTELQENPPNVSVANNREQMVMVSI